MEFDQLIQNDLIMHFEDAYNNKKRIENPIMYDKCMVDKKAYNNVIKNKNEFCEINTIGGPPNTKWYLYHCNDNKFIFINKVFNYFYCLSTYLWFYCCTNDLIELSLSYYGIEKKKSIVDNKKYTSLARFYDIDLASNDEDTPNIDYYVGTDLFDNKKSKENEITTNVNIYYNIPHEDGRLSLIHPDHIN